MTDRPGRDWFDRFQQASFAADVDAIWGLQTRASHALVEERMAEAIERARTDDAYRRLLEERMGADIRALAPREAWAAFTRASCEHMAQGDVEWRYLREEREGDRVLLTVAIVAGSRPLPPGMDGEITQVLVREDGAYRLDKPATEALGASPPGGGEPAAGTGA